MNWTDAADNESGFKLLRASLAAGPYALIATTAANTTALDDPAVVAGATYFYRVVAFNSAGDSASSNVATVTTAAASAPGTPTALSASVAANVVTLSWSAADNAATGFSIERSIDGAAFAPLGTTPASTPRYADTVDAPGLLVAYRVRASGAAGDSAYSNVSVVRMPGVATHTLTLQKSGAGSGSIVSTPAGLNCGSTCAAQFSAGSTVQLDATTAAGSTFGAWAGCDSSVGPRCTLTLNADTAIAASFAPVQTISLVANVPATSSDGSYTLSWTYAGAVPTGSWRIDEASNPSATSWIALFVTDTTAPFEQAYANKPDGRYCYRLRTGQMPADTYSAPVCVVVARPSTAVLRINNNTHYPLVRAVLNNQEEITSAAGAVAPGESGTKFFGSAGSVSFNLGVGSFNPDGSPDVWFMTTGTTSVSLGSTRDLPFNLGLPDLLANFSTDAIWAAEYYVSDTTSGFPVVRRFTAQFHFYRSGAWEFYDRGTRLYSGTSIPSVTWPDYATTIHFKFCSTCEDALLSKPFSSFWLYHAPAGGRINFIRE